MAPRHRRTMDPRQRGAESPPAGLPHHAVVADAAGRAAYRQLLDHSVRWRAYVQSLSGTYPRAPLLVEDLFYALYQADVELNPGIDSDLHRHFALLAGMLPMASFARLRRETVGDPMAAAMAARRLADELSAEGEGATKRETSGWRHPFSDLLARIVRGSGRRKAGERARTGGPAGKGEPPGTGEPGTRGGPEGGRGRSGIAANPVSDRPSVPVGGLMPGTLRALENTWRETFQDRHIRRVWGIEPGVRSAHALDDVWELVDAVRGLPGFDQLTDAFREMTELLQPASRGKGRRRRRQMEQGRFETLLGLSRGRDLERVVPEEWVRLLEDDMSGLFHEAYEHGRLLQERYGSKAPESPGPLVVCLDVSRSMNTIAAGGRERFVWAKGVGLALLETARRTHRPFLGICFSSEHDLALYEMPIGAYRPQVAIDLARCDFDGGTHFQAPLRAAVAYVERLRRPGSTPGAKGRLGAGHIVFVTDGQAALPDAFLRRFAAARRRLGLHMLTVFIDGQQSELVTASDRTLVVDGGRIQSWEQTAYGLGRALASTL